MKFSVIIPARLASSRLPEKALLDIAGKPMVVRVAERAQASGAANIWVATDSPEILRACQAHQIQALLTRADHPSGSDRLAEAIDLLELDDEEIILNVQGDEPLMPPQLIDGVASELAARPAAVMATAACPITQAGSFSNPNIVKLVINQQGLAMYFSRAPIPWPRDAAQAQTAGQTPIPEHLSPLHHIGIYAYRAKFLRRFPKLAPAKIEQCEALEQLRVLWHGYPIVVHVTQQAPAPGVDTAADLALVRSLWQTGQ